MNITGRCPEMLTMREPERLRFAVSKIFGTPSAAPMLEELLPVARQWTRVLLVCEQLALAGADCGGAAGRAER